MPVDTPLKTFAVTARGFVLARPSGAGTGIPVCFPSKLSESQTQTVR
jgi:hypothetical protein